MEKVQKIFQISVSNTSALILSLELWWKSKFYRHWKNPMSTLRHTDFQLSWVASFFVMIWQVTVFLSGQNQLATITPDWQNQGYWQCLWLEQNIAQISSTEEDKWFSWNILSVGYFFKLILKLDPFNLA